MKCGANILSKYHFLRSFDFLVNFKSNMADDANKLNRDFGIKAQNLVELGALGRQADPTFTHKRAIVSLANVVAHFTGKSLFKGGKERTSNWEQTLTEKMKECLYLLLLAALTNAILTCRCFRCEQRCSLCAYGVQELYGSCC